MRRVWIAIALAACGKSSPPSDPPRDDPWAGPAAHAPIDAPPPIDARPDAPPDAHEAPFARASAYELHTLGLALDDVDRDATEKWLHDEALRPSDVPADELPPDPPMPPATEHAVAMLVAWDRSGVPMSVGCGSPDIGALFSLVEVTKAALQASTRLDDPRVHAVLRASRALRDAGADPLALAVGVSFATSIARWAYAHQLRPESLLADTGPTRAEARAGALAAADCQLASLAKVRAAMREPDGRATIRGARRELGLSATDADVDAEPGQLETFLRGTRDVIEHATDDTVAREVDARVDAAHADTRSVMVRELGAPYPSRTVLQAFAEYQAALAGKPPPGHDVP